MPTIDTGDTTTQQIQQTNVGYLGQSSDGLVIADGGANNYSTGDPGIAQAQVYSGGVGDGSGTMWASVGSTFDVTGSEARNFTITATGNAKGEMMAGVGGSADAKISLICNQRGTDVSFSNVIAHREVNWPIDVAGFDKDPLSNMGSLGVTLDPNQTYEVLVRIQASMSLQKSGVAHCDFHDLYWEFELDDPHRVLVDSFEFVRG